MAKLKAAGLAVVDVDPKQAFSKDVGVKQIQAVPILFGSVGAMFGVTTVFLSNALILGASGLLMRRAGIPRSGSN